MGKKSKRNRIKPNKKKNDAILHDVVALLSSLNDLPFPVMSPLNGIRDLADFCMKNILEFSPEEKDSDTRHIAFHGYVSTQYNEETIWSLQDKRFCRRLAFDMTESKIIRTHALSLLLDFYFSEVVDPERQCYVFETIVDIFENATDQEKSRKVTSFPLGDVITYAHDRAKGSLQRLQIDRNCQVFLSDGKITLREQCGGGKCDFCKKSSLDLGLKRIPCCGKCQLSFYCSTECQHAAWKEGHREECRGKGDFRAGDQAFRREDGVEFELLEKVDGGKAWLVRLSQDGKEDTVPTRSMKRLRRELWQHLETISYINSLSESEQTKYEAAHTIDEKSREK